MLYDGEYLRLVSHWCRSWKLERGQLLPKVVCQQWAAEYIQKTPDPLGNYALAWNRVVWELYDSPIPHQAYACDRALDWVIRRQERRLMVEADQAQRNGQSIEEFGLVQKALDLHKLAAKARTKFLTFGENTALEFSSLQEVIPRHVIPMGWPEVDEVCNGGMGRRELWLAAAPPNTGKTTTLCNWAARWLMQGRLVVYVTLEQQDTQIRDKVISATARQPAALLRRDPETLRRWSEWVFNRGGMLAVQEYPSGHATVEQVYSDIALIGSQYSRAVDVVIVDYADLLKLPASKDHRHGLNQIYVKLRGLAQMQDTLVVSATQTNRSSVHREAITIDYLAEDFQKAAVADGVISLCQTQQEQQSGHLRMFWAKNRHGPKFSSVLCEMQPSICTLDTISTSTAQAVLPNPAVLANAFLQHYAQPQAS